METTKIVLGKSPNTISMLLDNWSSHDLKGKIILINNLNLETDVPYEHPDFDIEELLTLPKGDNFHFFLGVVKPEFKRKIVEGFNLSPSQYGNCIFKDFDCSKTTHLGRGILVNSKVSVAAQSHIGNFVTLNRNVSIGHHCKIDDFCSINPGVNIAGRVTIGKGTTIGIGASIIDGVSIGENTVIGAGSVVTRDIPSNVVAYGSPCKVVKSR